MNFLVLLLLLQPAHSRLEERVQDADLVMVGEVVKTYPLHRHMESAPGDHPIRVAIVRQSEILKKNDGVLVTARGVMVLYTNFQDGAPLENPKLHVGQRALFALNLETIEIGGGHEDRRLLVFHNSDLFDEDQLLQAEKLLKRRK